MLKINEYFGGRVISISFQSVEGPATIGVMEKGEYKLYVKKFTVRDK